MKLDLEDGRVLSLPDEVSDEFARQLKALILTTEGRARDAEARAERIATEMAALRQDFTALASRPMSEFPRQDNSDVVAALQALEKAVRADRVMVADDFGEFTRSRIG
jgi:hypothetical protein